MNGESSSASPAPQLPSGRVLFADDDEPFRIGLSRRLVRAGFECDLAATGAQAAQLLRDRTYDVLLADIDMPGNQRLELVEEIPVLAPTLPVVLLTGRPSLESAVQSVNLKVSAYLTKPPEFDELCRVLSLAAVGHREARLLRENRGRLQDWDRELARLQNLLEQPTPEARPSAMRGYLRLTLRNLVVGLVELENLLVSGSATGGEAGLLEKQELIAALRKTIAVLEKTRGQFKSKELGDLRKELENLLQ